jgi:predicted nucleotidyltransferase
MNGHLSLLSSKVRETLFAALRAAAIEVYGERLVSLAVFGSWARGTPTTESDLDLLVVAHDLPPSRMKRVREFRSVEAATQLACDRVWGPIGPRVELSPIFKSPESLRAGSPLYLDMTLWCDILVDRGATLRHYLDGLRARMESLGSQRKPFKGGWFWDYKPGVRPGEVVEL